MHGYLAGETAVGKALGIPKSTLENLGGLMSMDKFDLSFYKGKKVFVTGHTGFKGSWLCKMLANAGAVVTGLRLQTLNRM